MNIRHTALQIKGILVGNTLSSSVQYSQIMDTSATTELITNYRSVIVRKIFSSDRKNMPRQLRSRMKISPGSHRFSF